MEAGNEALGALLAENDGLKLLLEQAGDDYGDIMAFAELERENETLRGRLRAKASEGARKRASERFFQEVWGRFADCPERPRLSLELQVARHDNDLARVRVTHDDGRKWSLGVWVKSIEGDAGWTKSLDGDFANPRLAMFADAYEAGREPDWNRPDAQA